MDPNKPQPFSFFSAFLSNSSAFAMFSPIFLGLVVVVGAAAVAATIVVVTKEGLLPRRFLI